MIPTAGWWLWWFRSLGIELAFVLFFSGLFALRKGGDVKDGVGGFSRIAVK